MERTVTATEANRDFSRIFRDVARGERAVGQDRHREAHLAGARREHERVRAGGEVRRHGDRERDPSVGPRGGDAGDHDRVAEQRRRDLLTRQQAGDVHREGVSLLDAAGAVVDRRALERGTQLGVGADVEDQPALLEAEVAVADPEGGPDHAVGAVASHDVRRPQGAVVECQVHAVGMGDQAEHLGLVGCQRSQNPPQTQCLEA